MKFVIVGKTSKSKGDITKTVMELGGHIASKIGADTAACISTKGWYPIFCRTKLNILFVAIQMLYQIMKLVNE